MRNIEEARSEVSSAQQQALSAKALYEFLSLNKALNCHANIQLLTEFHAGSEMTLQSLQEAVGLLGDQLARKKDAQLERESADSRAQSLETISRITGIPTVDESGVPTDPNLRWKTDAELAARALSLEQRRSMSKKSIPELRQIIRDAKPVEAAPEAPAEWTRSYLLALPASAFRKAIDRVGIQKITELLNKR